MEFLKRYRVRDEIAHLYARGLEHHLHSQTTKKTIESNLIVKKSSRTLLGN
jgi:Mn-dependent DtxR family transcriptional regulator